MGGKSWDPDPQRLPVALNVVIVQIQWLCQGDVGPPWIFRPLDKNSRRRPLVIFEWLGTRGRRDRLDFARPVDSERRQQDYYDDNDEQEEDNEAESVDDSRRLDPLVTAALLLVCDAGALRGAGCGRRVVFTSLCWLLTSDGRVRLGRRVARCLQPSHNENT